MGAIASKIPRKHRTYPGNDFEGKSVFGESMARTAEWEQMKKTRRISMGHQVKGPKKSTMDRSMGAEPSRGQMFQPGDFDEKKDAEDEKAGGKKGGGGGGGAAATNPNKQMAVLVTVMKDPYECRLFRLFLETEFCAELLDFAICIDRFEAIAHVSLVPVEATRDMVEAAQAIYDDFLAEGAKYFVALPGARAIEEALLMAVNNKEEKGEKKLTNQSFVSLRAEAVALRESPPADCDVQETGYRIKELIHAIALYEHHESQPQTKVAWMNYSDLLAVATRIFQRFMSPASKWFIPTTAATALGIKRKLVTGVIEADLFDQGKAETNRLLAGEKLERYALWIECEKAMAEFFRIRELFKKSDAVECVAADEVFDIVPFGEPDERPKRRASRIGSFSTARRGSDQPEPIHDGGHAFKDGDDFGFSMKDFTVDRDKGQAGGARTGHDDESTSDGSVHAPDDDDDDDDSDSDDESTTYGTPSHHRDAVPGHRRRGSNQSSAASDSDDEDSDPPMAPRSGNGNMSPPGHTRTAARDD